MSGLFEQTDSILIQGGAWLNIPGGLWATVRIFVLSLVLGMLLGALACALRMSKLKPMRWAAQLYIAVLRGSLVLMLLMRMYYVVFACEAA